MAPDELAAVDKLLVAQQIAPSESLAVRLVGTVGPDGSWALERIEVQQSPGRILFLPHVRRVAGDSFIQMVIPLDRTVCVAVPAGRYRVEARGRTGVVGSEVVVAENARRTPPRAYVDVQAETPVGDEVVVTLRLEGRVDSGFVDRLEVREATGAALTDWRSPDSIERTTDGLLGSISIRRPAGDAERRIEVRARDGQGTWSPAVRSVLPAR